MRTYAESGEGGVKLALEEIIKSSNVAKSISEDLLDSVGMTVSLGYRADVASREEWEQRMEKAIKLALQVQESKSFPWQDCSNVKFPLVTIAVLQFLARISLMTKGSKLAKVKTIGKDPLGKKSQIASQISEHLSLQLAEFSPNWVEEDEQAKLAAAILGSAFKKTYYDAISGQVISEHIPIANFVVDYYTKDIAKARRATQRIFMSGNDIQERVASGIFLDVGEEVLAGAADPTVNFLQQGTNEAEGIRPMREESFAMYEVLEQHCWLDLDGDGYEEPYVVSVLEKNSKVLRILARFTDTGDVHRVNDTAVQQLESMAKESEDVKRSSSLERQAERLDKAPDNHIIRIDPIQYFTRYLFIPSPDGGIYGLGFGSLLGPLNESVDTLVNQLIDSGTMANTAGGFLGRGVKIKGGVTSFSPFEWKPIDSPGADIRQNIFPLPVREPSNVLFQLLGLLVSYSEKVGSSTDIMTGVSPGQNTPAETSRNTVEQGMMLFSGIYARMYRCFRGELQKFYRLNQLYFHSSPNFFELTQSENAIISKDAYSGESFFIYPAASPDAVSLTQLREKAAMLVKLAQVEPGFNRYLAVRKMLEAYDYEDIDQLFPDPKGPNPIAPVIPPKIQIEQAKLKQSQQEHQDNMTLAVAKLQESIKVSEATIQELEAKAAMEMAKANGTEVGHQLALLDAQIGAEKSHKQSLMDAAELMHRVNIDHQQLALARGKQHHEQQAHQPSGAIENGNSNSNNAAGMGTEPSNQGVPQVP